jgi:hypothetical protein
MQQTTADGESAQRNARASQNVTPSEAAYTPAGGGGHGVISDFDQSALCGEPITSSAPFAQASNASGTNNADFLQRSSRQRARQGPRGRHKALRQGLTAI